MRTVHLSEQDFSEVHAAMVAAMDGQDVLITVLVSRLGESSKEVKVETERYERMAEAERSLRGVSSWRSGGDKNPRQRKIPSS